MGDVKVDEGLHAQAYPVNRVVALVLGLVGAKFVEKDPRERQECVPAVFQALVFQLVLEVKGEHVVQECLKVVQEPRDFRGGVVASSFIRQCQFLEPNDRERERGSMRERLH